MPKLPMRTTVAQQATDVSDIINLSLASRVAGTPPRRVCVTAPDVVSTEGGRKARQSIMLEPVEQGLGDAIMCGWLDVAQKTAELRTHRAVSALYRERFRKELRVEPAEYEGLMTVLSQLLGVRDIQVSRDDEADAGRRSSVEAGQAKGRGAALAMVSAGAILAAAIVAAALILR